MKLNSYQLDKYKQTNKFALLRLILVYGPDEIGIDHIVEQCIKDFDSLNSANITRVEYKNIKDNFIHIIDELNSTSLFASMNIVVINDCPNSLPKSIIDILTNHKFVGKLILKANDLKPHSNLRKFFESHKQALSIACYKDDISQIQQFITQYLQQNNAKFDNNIVKILTSLMPSNKLLIKQEIDKLLLYCQSDPIDEQSVYDVISDAFEIQLDDLCQAVALNDKSNIIRLMDKAKEQGINFMLIIKVIQIYFSRILEILILAEKGQQLQNAIDSLKPPVFFKQKNSMIIACKALTLDKITNFLRNFVNVELNCKKMPLNQYLIICNFLILEL